MLHRFLQVRDTVSSLPCTHVYFQGKVVEDRGCVGDMARGPAHPGGRTADIPEEGRAPVEGFLDKKVDPLRFTHAPGHVLQQHTCAGG